MENYIPAAIFFIPLGAILVTIAITAFFINKFSPKQPTTKIGGFKPPPIELEAYRDIQF